MSGVIIFYFILILLIIISVAIVEYIVLTNIITNKLSTTPLSNYQIVTSKTTVTPTTTIPTTTISTTTIPTTTIPTTTIPTTTIPTTTIPTTTIPTTTIPTTTIPTTTIPTTTFPYVISQDQVPKTLIGYFPNYSIYGRKFFPVNIPIDYIPEISYSFFNYTNTTGLYKMVSSDIYADAQNTFSDTGTFVSPGDTWNDKNTNGAINEFVKLKALGKKFNLRLAIGGYGYSANFSSAVADENNRQSFSQSIVDWIVLYPIFTAIDIDWEYLSGNGINYGSVGNIATTGDPANFLSFLKTLKTKLTTANLSSVTIGICVTPAPEKIAFDPIILLPYVDLFEIMTYDFHDGAWGETTTAHHTNPRKSSFGKYSCEEAADAWIAKGVPSTKILIGAAFYSRGYSNVISGTTNGLGRTCSGGSTDVSNFTGAIPGTVNYSQLPLPGSTEYWDSEAKSPYSYDPIKKIFNSYDNIASVIEKCAIVYQKNLKGIICWELSGDSPVITNKNLTQTLFQYLIQQKNEFTNY
jgi:chitinase